MAHFIATTERTSAEGLMQLFQDHIWKLHGLPESIISNRGVQFVAGMMRELNDLDNHGKVVHRPYSGCISSIQKIMGTSSSSSCQLGLGG